MSQIEVFSVVDTFSRNVMGEFEGLEEAKALYLELVAAHPPNATEVVILLDDGTEQPVSRNDVIAALTAAADSKP